MKIERTYTYLFIKNDVIEKIMTSKEIYQTYGIKSMKRKFLLDESPIIDGYLVIENTIKENFKKIDENKENNYYISSLGYVLQVSKSDRKRTVLKSYITKSNELIAKTYDHKVIYIAHEVAYNFIKKCNFKIQYLDGNPKNCKVQNLKINPISTND